MALTKKEINRFFTSSAYIMNAGLGNVMLLILAVIAIINRNNVLSILSEFSIDFTKYVPAVITMFGIFMSSMDFITAPSISLENKNLWILQSSPIRPYTIFMAKISSHMIICTPLNLISVAILCVAFGVSFALSLLCVIAQFCAPLSKTAFCAV